VILPLAVNRDNVADYVGALFLVYLIMIFIRVLLSWIPRMPYNRYLRAAVGFVVGTLVSILATIRFAIAADMQSGAINQPDRVDELSAAAQVACPG